MFDDLVDSLKAQGVERGAYSLIFNSDVTESLLLSINFCHCKY
jgi:hypothetical protein